MIHNTIQNILIKTCKSATSSTKNELTRQFFNKNRQPEDVLAALAEVLPLF